MAPGMATTVTADPVAALLVLEAMPGMVCNPALVRVLLLRWLMAGAAP
jgi:hypothetical protein